MTFALERLRTHVYRVHHPRWSHSPESGAGAALHGGRFNRVGTDCLYTSLTPETAWLEAQQGFPFKAQPMTLCAYEIDCEGMLDLTSALGRQAAGIPFEVLGCAWEHVRAGGEDPSSWQLSDTLREAGVAGLLVPSFASRATGADVNAVFWSWSAEPPCRVAVIDDFARLPKNDASWH